MELVGGRSVAEEAVGLAIMEAIIELLTKMAQRFDEEGEKTFTGHEVASLLRSTGATFLIDA